MRDENPGRSGPLQASLLQDAMVHGGGLAAAMTAYPEAPSPWIDLSTGINPDPWAGPRASLDRLARLPDPRMLAQLEAVAARAFGVADPTRVVATAGAETGLRWLPRLLPAIDIEIVSPTYGGHESAWRGANVPTRPILPEHLAVSTASAALVVNPNNPDGRTFARDALRAIVEPRALRRSWTIVDESFVDATPDVSVAGVECDRLVVLRSFGKFYGLAGLRLGFVIAPPETAARLRSLQGDWPVSAEAVVMGLEAYADADWATRTRAQLTARAAEMDHALGDAGLRVLGGVSLFRLASIADAAGAFAALCRDGILTRPFAQRPDWLRFGLPRREDLPRVCAALQGLGR